MPTAPNMPNRKSLIAQRQRHDVVDLLRGGPVERGDVLFGDHRIAERVVLVIELDDRARQRRAFLDAEARATASRPPRCGTTTSSGMISTSRTSCSRMFSRLDEVGGHADRVQLRA